MLGSITRSIGQTACCSAPCVCAHFGSSPLDRRRRGSTTKTNRAARAGLDQQPALEGSEARLQRERCSTAARQRARRAQPCEARRRKALAHDAEAAVREFSRSEERRV